MTGQTLSAFTIVPELDGVRGVAILLVLAFHFGHVLPAPGNVVFGLGWTGVDLFFALSGYLITRILWATKESRNYFVAFYGRRCLRIFPLAFAFLAAYFWIALPLQHRFRHHLDQSGADQLWYWAYLANWHNGAHGGLSHLWSLSIEEQFYLVWPSVVFLSSKKTLQRICTALIALPLALRFLLIHVFHYQLLTRGLTICRTEALALGALIAISEDTRILRWLAVPSMLGLLVVWATSGNNGNAMGIYGLTLVAFACAAFVNQVVRIAGNNSITSRSLRAPWLTRFGKYSYGIYVLHAPILAAAFSLSARTSSPLKRLAIFGGGIAVSYLAGWISWNYFESRILKLKRYFTYDQPAIRAPEALVTQRAC